MLPINTVIYVVRAAHIRRFEIIGIRIAIDTNTFDSAIKVRLKAQSLSDHFLNTSPCQNFISVIISTCNNYYYYLYRRRNILSFRYIVSYV